MPQHVSVLCPVCQSLLYGRVEDVGKPIKCADCGAQTILPPPEKVLSRQAPAAMEGEQYELWGVDEAPSVAEMLAAQPKYIAVECRTCQALMHATEDQVGLHLKCPDCGTLQVVPSPARPVPVREVLTADEDDFEINLALDPGERPSVIALPRRRMLYEEEHEAELARQAEKKARGEQGGVQYDLAGRPVMPRWPLATRVLPFLFSRGVPVRWIMLSVVLFAALGVMLLGSWMAVQGGLGVVGGMSFWGIGLIGCMLWAAAFAAIVVTIVTESATGNDEIQHWPAPVVTDWFGESLIMLIACLVSPLPGSLIGWFLAGNPGLRLALFMVSLLVTLPVVLLSQLELGSAFAVVSPRVLTSMLRLPAMWLVFYAEMLLLIVVCAVVTLAAEWMVPVLGFALLPVYIGATLLAARLLGRLGWVLAESLEEVEGEENDVAE